MSKRTPEELDRIAAETEALLDTLDPDDLLAENTDDLRAITNADDAVTAASKRLEDAVATAKANGRSWARIGMALGISRQAAQQRFGVPVAR